jgi:hypothetical protein
VKFVMSLTEKMGGALNRLATREGRPLVQIVRELIAERVGMKPNGKGK